MTIAASPTVAAPKIGMIAGWGRYPLLVAESLAQQGFQVYCLGGKQHADPAIAQLCHDFQWIGMGQVGRGPGKVDGCRIG